MDTNPFLCNAMTVWEGERIRCTRSTGHAAAHCHDDGQKRWWLDDERPLGYDAEGALRRGIIKGGNALTDPDQVASR